MSTKKKRNSKEEAQKSDKTVQYIAIAAIAIVIAVIVWQYISKPQQVTEIATEIAADVAESTPEIISTATDAATGTAESVEAATEVMPQDFGTAAACAAFDSITAAAKYDAPPMKIDEAKQYFAAFKMAKGEFVVELYPAKSPITVNSFVFLSCKEYFNGITFHRVLEDFMAQGGDPTGTGSGGPGYEFVNENSDLTFDKAGVMAMANAGPDTNGSQFFITFAPADFLNGGYTIFGQVVAGMEVVNAITFRDPNTNPSFEGDVIESVTITEK